MQKEGIMKRIPTRLTFAIRSLLVIATVAILCAAPVATTLKGDENDQKKDLLYTGSSSGGSAELFAMEVSGRKITTTDIGPLNGGDCASLAMSPSGTLFSMCGALFGAQRLATVDTKTGLASLFGVPVSGLAIMAMAFAPNGILYAVGDCNPDTKGNFECTPDSDPNYNSLYKVNTATGAVTRVGSTGAPQFFMDLAFDRDGNMFGVTTTLNSSLVPAILYRVDLATGAATKIVNLVGSNSVMGLAFGREGKLYATDWTQDSGLYLIDIKTGFETAIAALPFGLSSGLELANPAEDRE
jgi:DNA-binding beta-propeller fold protein YncE